MTNISSELITSFSATTSTNNAKTSTSIDDTFSQLLVSNAKTGNTSITMGSLTMAETDDKNGSIQSEEENITFDESSTKMSNGEYMDTTFVSVTGSFSTQYNGDTKPSCSPSERGNILSEIKKMGLDTLSAPTTSVTIAATLDVLIPSYQGTYKASIPAENMASGAIEPEFARNFAIFDASGNAHIMQMDLLKLANNKWAVEIVASPPTDVKSSDPNGLVASGTLTFNANGSLASVSPSLSKAINISWSDGAKPSDITFNLSEFTQNASVTVSSVTQNGAETGKLTGVDVGKNGKVTLSYDNGLTKTITLPSEYHHRSDRRDA